MRISSRFSAIVNYLKGKKNRVNLIFYVIACILVTYFYSFTIFLSLLLLFLTFISGVCVIVELYLWAKNKNRKLESDFIISLAMCCVTFPLSLYFFKNETLMYVIPLSFICSVLSIVFYK